MTEEGKPTTLAEMLDTEDVDEQMKRVDTLLRIAHAQDLVVVVHFKPATKEVFFGTTTQGLGYDNLIAILSEGIKAASAMKAASQTRAEEVQKKEGQANNLK